MIINKPKVVKQSEKLQTANIKGTVKVEIMPKFIQSGQSLEISKFNRYLVVQILNLINVFESTVISRLQEASVWVDVEWGGISYGSKRVKSRALNEVFYFQLAIPDESTFKGKDKSNQLADMIIEELSTKPEITLSVWADPNDGEVLSIGYAKVQLSEIA